MKSRFLSFLIFSTVFVGMFSDISSRTIHAQNIQEGTQSIVLEQSTDNPTPGETVTITARSYSFDINSTTNTWTVGNKVVQKGIGSVTIDVKAPALGKKTTVRITAISPDGAVYSSSITLGSGSIDMIVETDGYVPPFFRGKLNPVYQNFVKIVAVPHLADASGKEYNPSNLIYKWKKDNDTVMQDQSGYGKQSISLEGNMVPRPYSMYVTVTSRDGSAQGEGSVEVEASSPFVNFYTDDPLYGTFFNKSITDSIRIGSQKETSVLAVPYGFNMKVGGKNSLSLNWLINNILHNELASSRSVILRAPEGEAGSSNIHLSVKNSDNILQGADGGFSAYFNEKESTTQSTSVTF